MVLQQKVGKGNGQIRVLFCVSSSRFLRSNENCLTFRLKQEIFRQPQKVVKGNDFFGLPREPKIFLLEATKNFLD